MDQTSNTDNKITLGMIEVVDIIENDDDTFTVTFDMSSDVMQALLSYTIKTAIMNTVGDLSGTD